MPVADRERAPESGNPIGNWFSSGSRMDVGGSKRRKGSGSEPSRRKSVVAPSRGAAPRKPSRSADGEALKLAFTFPSDYAKAHTVQKQILDAAEKRGFGGESFFALRIALEEGLVNAIKHGNRLDREKLVRVAAKVTRARAEITVEDEGAGFERHTVPDPTANQNLHRCSGRGILLIEAYMSEVKWDHGGRRLRMVRENRG
ncbi:MAG TPA: ATP-binding protein [Tepidisphaeraceae bacterium]|jgi:serine/threonine-protein kinase RsbW|nr:ATP-binding protein [Tepidisphaeraceae bacterium]